MPRVMRRSRQASWTEERRDLGKRKRDVAADEAPERKHRRREEAETVSSRTSRYETRSGYRRREELQRERERESRRERDQQDETDLRRQGRDRAVQTERFRDSRDYSGGVGRHRELERRERRDASKKARDRERKYGTDGYKSRKTSSARFESKNCLCNLGNTHLLDPQDATRL